MLTPSQMTRVPPGIPWGLGLQGLRETMDGSPAGRQEEQWRMCTLRSWATGSRGRRSGIRSPAEPLSQCKDASVNLLRFIEPESGEQNLGERQRNLKCLVQPHSQLKKKLRV